VSDQTSPNHPPARERSARTDPHVLILLATRNGADHLLEQLDSLVAQRHENWTLWASDDGSTDDTRTILEDFASQRHQTRISNGPCRGGSENFLSLLRAVPKADYGTSWIAFCDQDDVWLPDRLSHGLAALDRVPLETPALFCSGMLITDNDLAHTRRSKPRPRPPDFRNALVQNIASGNTILLNPAGAHLVCAAAHEVGAVVVHDWWVYQLISGAGGRVIHDDTPLIYYRQHPDNQIGANDTRRAQLKRIKMLIDGHFRDWNEINIAALRASCHRLSAENQLLLSAFAEMRQSALPARFLRFWKLGLYRQNLPGRMALWLSVLLHRL
jgi:glycosyltransferase involved in cell wall biosynthesis